MHTAETMFEPKQKNAEQSFSLRYSRKLSGTRNEQRKTPPATSAGGFRTICRSAFEPSPFFTSPRTHRDLRTPTALRRRFREVPHSDVTGNDTTHLSSRTTCSCFRPTHCLGKAGAIIKITPMPREPPNHVKCGVLPSRGPHRMHLGAHRHSVRNETRAAEQRSIMIASLLINLLADLEEVASLDGLPA